MMKRSESMILQTLLLAVFVGVLVIVAFPSALGHGVGYETLPPQSLDGKKVAMEVNSKTDNSTGKKQLSFFLFDTNTGITIRDVKYQIKAIKNGDALFDEIYESRNGVMTLELIPDKSDKITTLKKQSGSLLDSIFGMEKNTLDAKGKIFGTGGLYKFSIKILAAESYSGKSNPVTFESGISFPEYTTIEVNDAHFGRQEITQISYYDTITNLGYGAKARSITFSMPFEWTISNINQTSVVHQEIVIPKTFGTLQVSEYAVTVNGVLLSNQTMTVDDFPRDSRIVHLVLYQAELERLYEKQENHGKMDFVLFPKSDDIILVGTTDNIQYKVAVTSIPKHVYAGDDVTFLFQIYDIFLSGRSVSASYDVVIDSNGNDFYKTSGKSLGEKTKWNEIKLTIPQDAQNKLVMRFENLGGNGLARTEIPIVLSSQNTVPSWIKNNAGWWCNDSISDDEFLRGTEYLISKGIIRISYLQQDSITKEIPQWSRDNACSWSDGSISDSEFLDSISFLVKNGLVTP